MNAVRGLLDMIARLATEYEPTEIVACWDNDWRPQWRVDLIPTYKTHRIAAEPATDADPAIESVPDPLSQQIPIIRLVLDALGSPIIGAARHEADDVIGALALHASIPVDIVTGDRDLDGIARAAADPRPRGVAHTGRRIVSRAADATPPSDKGSPSPDRLIT